MKTKFGLLALAALLLLSGCDAIFDTLIETVYKDEIDKNAFGAVEVPVTIYVGSNWDSYLGDGDLKLALVPYYNASGGIVPDWGGRIERYLDWNSRIGYSYDSRFETSFSVQKGFASWRLFIWQPSPGNEDRILEGVEPDGDPSKVLMFNFNEGWGSNEVLDDYNLDSGPYVAEWFYYEDRAPTFVIEQLYGTSSGIEAMSISGAQYIDRTEALNGYGYYFSVSRYSSETFKRVREIQVQRQDTDDTLLKRSWEPDWLVFPVADWNEYNSYFDFNLSFEGLSENGDGVTLFDLSEPLELEVKLVYEDGSELAASPAALQINFYSSAGAEIPAWTPFQVDFSVDRNDDPGYGSKLAKFILYDENWSYLLEVDSTLDSGGYISLANFRGFPSYSSVQGGRYKLRTIVDTNGDGLIGGYYDGVYYDYDQYTDKEFVVTTDGGSTYDVNYGTVYIGVLSFTNSDYWYSW